MVDITSIAGSIGALKSAIDILRSISDARDMTLVQSKVADLQREIIGAQLSALNAQAEQFELIQANRELTEKIKALETWSKEKERYVLEELAPGAFAYSLRTDAIPKEPLHQICAGCYNRGQKSILQHEMRTPGRSNVFVCNSCSEEVYVNGMRFPEHSPNKKRK